MLFKHQDISAFLPAALEVRDRAVHPASHITSGTLLLLFSTLLVWAWWGEIDIVARAEGKIVPFGQVKPVQASEAGTVSEILVKEGQEVFSGQPLIRLSPELLDTEIERVRIKLESGELILERQQRLLELIDLNEQGMPLPEYTDLQLMQEFGGFQMRLIQLERMIAERHAAQKKAQQMLTRIDAVEPLVRQRADALRALALKGNGARLDYLTEKERHTQLIHDREASLSELAQLEAELDARETERIAYVREKRTQVLALIENYTTENELEHQLLKQLHQRRTKLDIRAHLAGRVKDLKVYSTGAVVAVADQLMTIVPKEEPLEAEVWLENRDIGFVQAGDTSEVKLETFPFTRYGVLHGRVSELSADATQTDTSLLYKARIALNSREIEVDNRIVSLIPGMGVTAEINTGRRRIIDYIFDPLLRYKNESLRER